ncbi:lipid-A-disaccharide synthase-related protein [Planktothrix agardhii 1033]|nr:lipid-A-disaccharide synthase-related protein [Planktothrix agardhii 1033]
MTVKILSVSNGHGEDAIAVRILRELQKQPHPPELAALPLVGLGQSYTQLDNVPIIGSIKSLPSGGFIYMDKHQLWRDLQAGLFPLIIQQYQTIRQWVKQGGIILAVGDIVPLFLAWLSGGNYAFIGTAKSDYYLRDEQEKLPLIGMWKWYKYCDSIYFPWERWLMNHSRCLGVFPRDTITTKTLQKYGIPAIDLGNPMMDNLEPNIDNSNIDQLQQRSLFITILPGSRSPEVNRNWDIILQGVDAIIKSSIRSTENPIPSYQELVFLGAIASSLDLQPFCQSLTDLGWQETPDLRLPNINFPWGHGELIFSQEKARLILTNQAFNDCLALGDIAIAMAGTATEQFVGLGKPAIAIPGEGPQFTPTFANNQQRLLGQSLIIVENPTEIPEILRSLLLNSEQLKLIAENGKRRLGQPGASRRIAQYLP